MHIDINDNTTLREIQKVFNDFYPYLQIRFYRKAHKRYEVSQEEDAIDANTTIGNIKQTHVSGLLEVQPMYRVSDVEKEFQQRFGLSVQVFHKEKNDWMQSAGMDNLTLKELEEISRNSSDEFIVEDYEQRFEESSDKPENLY